MSKKQYPSTNITLASLEDKGLTMKLKDTEGRSWVIWKNEYQTNQPSEAFTSLMNHKIGDTFGVIYSEKSGSLAELSLSANSIAGLSGPNRPVLLPNAPNNDTPFGMIARGANAYVTIAHSNLEALVVNGQIVATAAGLTPFKDASGGFLHAPCWNALSGQFLYSADSPGKQLFRYLVSDTNVFFDKAGAAKFAGPGSSSSRTPAPATKPARRAPSARRRDSHGPRGTRA